jgi:hypothetical protein
MSGFTKVGSVGAIAMVGMCAMAGAGSASPSYEWVKVTTTAPFAARDGAGALVYKDRMWLIGGWNPRDKVNFPRICNNEVWSSVDGLAWTLIKPNTFLDAKFDPASDWEGRHTAGYVVYKDKMWIIGGDCNQGHYHPDVWNSEDGKVWTRVTGSLPWGHRALQLVYAFKGKIWAMGGQTMPGFVKDEKFPETFYNDVWCSEDGSKWTRVLEHAPWSPRGMSSGVVIFNDRLWILGGGTYDTPTTKTRQFYNDVWSTADGVEWTRHIEHAPWHPRQYHEVAVWDGKMWVMEGWNGKNRNDVWYSSDGVNWAELPGTPWAIRHAASVFVYQDALWMVAGNNMEPDVWKLVRK